MCEHRFSAVTVLIFFFTMLLFPGTVFLGASKGLLLWFQIVLPTLLPYMILVNLMLHTPAIHLICRIVSPVLCPLLHISYYGAFAVVTGFLCGYPMGAKTISDLLDLQKISRTEACYLLSFCNNTSPAFLLSYVITQNLKGQTITIPFFLIVALTPLFMSFLFRLYYHRQATGCSSSVCSVQNETARLRPPLSLPDGFFDSCIMNAFESITRIGGYMILFSICVQLLSKVLSTDSAVFLLIGSSLEISTGIRLISGSILPEFWKIIGCGALSSFGGWCCIAQTHALTAQNHLPILPYITEKLVTALVTSLLLSTYIYIL